MTRSRYFLATALQKFGVIRKTKRLTDASYEMHLMQDGEEILGASCWQNTEDIEELSLEYWNLRGLARKKKQILDKLQAAETQMSEALSRKASILSDGPDPSNPSSRRKKELAGELKSLQHDHETKMAAALATKRKHRALKMKLEILQEESGSEEEIKACLAGLSELRKSFMSEKTELEEMKKQVEIYQTELRSVEERIGVDARGAEGETNQAYALISKANRVITTCQAELAAIEEEQNEIFRTVGHFLNLNAKRRDCHKACKNQRVLLTQIRLLFLSIKLNRQLVEKLGH